MDCIEDAELLGEVWNQIVTPQTIYDTWWMRNAFFAETEYILQGFVDDRRHPTALLPLQRHRKTRQVRYIATPFLERNRGFCISGCEHTLKALYQSVVEHEQSYVLEDISATDPISATSFVTEGDPAYLYDLEAQHVQSLGDVLASIPSGSVRRRMRAALSYVGTSLDVVEQPIGTVAEALIEIGQERFGGDSWLAHPGIRNGVQHLAQLELDEVQVAGTILVTKAGQVVGGHIGARYYHTYHALLAMSERNASFPELATLLHLQNFANAISTGSTLLDTGLGDCGWKEKWGLARSPQYTFV